MDSLGFFTSIALGFVPKDPLGPDNKPKTTFQNKLENLSKKRSESLISNVFLDLVVFFYCVNVLFSDLFPVFLKFCFGLKSGPRGSFGTKPGSIDVKNPKESENMTQNH